MKNFWSGLTKPIFALAPMEDVTDAAFRTLIARYGKPDVTFTEFTSADGLVRADEKGQKQLRKKLIYSDAERPIVAQLFSATPEYMREAVKMVADMGFDGIDINMGCPVNEVVRQACGAALIQDPPLARELIAAAKESGLPVSVKTRIGYNQDELETWIPELLAEKPAALTLHLRTRKEMSEVPAHWERMARAVQLRNEISPETILLGNGDVKDLNDAREKIASSGCDGVMLGRAIYGNPWLFAQANNPEQSRGTERSPEEKIGALLEHLKLFDQLLGGLTNYAVMKKHFKAYISGWDNAKELRIKLM